MTNYMDFRFEFDDLPDPITLEERTSYIERMHVEYDKFLGSYCKCNKSNGLMRYENRLAESHELSKIFNESTLEDYKNLDLLSEVVVLPDPPNTDYRTREMLQQETRYHDPDEFRIYRGFFPFSEYKGYGKVGRPMIPFRVNWTDDYIVIPLTSKYDRTIMSYDVDMVDWKHAGLTRASRARPRDIRKIDRVSLTSRKGFVSNRDLVNIRNSFDKMMNDQFKRPDAFFGWLINNEIKYESINNNLNKPIRTLNKVKHEKAIDCLELAIITYKMCVNCNEISNSGIGFGLWENEEKHREFRPFVIFKAINQFWTVQYIKGDLGYVERHKNKSLSDFVKSENKDLSEGYYKYSKLCGKRKLIKQGLLSPIELKILAEDNSKYFKTHRELLNFLDLKNRKGL